MSENPAGAVTLELIIEDTAQKQIESIARRAAKPAEAAFHATVWGSTHFFVSII